MQYYLPIERNKAMPRVIAWVILENIMLNERNESQKITYSMKYL